MGKGAKSDETKQESKEGLLAFEEGFTSKLGAANKCCCCKLSIGVQLIAVLVVLAALNYFLTFVSRTGAPCFFWYNHVATTITVVLGMAARLVAIPCAILGMLGARKADDKGPRLFFYCLMGLSVVCFLDLFLCLFEVHAVCTSDELLDWNSCAHDWGKNQYHCTAVNATDADAASACAAVEQQLAQNGGDDDEAACTAVDGCQYLEMLEDDWVTPECCEHANWSADKGPCNRAPRERRAEFDSDHCEFISDVYDVGLGIVWTLMLFLMAWYVNAYRVDLARAGDTATDAPEFKNPMNEGEDEDE